MLVAAETTSLASLAILNTRCTIFWSRSFFREVMQTHRFKPLNKIFWMSRSPSKQSAGFWVHFFERRISELAAHEIQKKSKHQTRYGVGKIWPFSYDALWTIPISANKMAWHFGRTCGWSTTTPLWSLDCRIFRGSLQEQKKTGRHIQFSTHLWGGFLQQRGSGWLVCFSRSPGKARALSKSVPN